jgi:hypothetical protein
MENAVKKSDEMFAEIAQRTAKILKRDLEVQAMDVENLSNEELGMTIAIAKILSSSKHLDKKLVKQLTGDKMGKLGEQQIYFSTARAILEVIGETDEAVN